MAVPEVSVEIAARLIMVSERHVQRLAASGWIEKPYTVSGSVNALPQCLQIVASLWTALRHALLTTTKTSPHIGTAAPPSRQNADKHRKHHPKQKPNNHLGEFVHSQSPHARV
jgi:hypothetical protein